MNCMNLHEINFQHISNLWKNRMKIYFIWHRSWRGAPIAIKIDRLVSPKGEA